MIHSKEAFRHLLSFYFLLHFRHMSFGLVMSLSNLKIGTTESGLIYLNYQEMLFVIRNIVSFNKVEHELIFFKEDAFLIKYKKTTPCN